MPKRKGMILRLCIGLFLLVFGTPVLADEVSIDWNPQEGAAKYELEVSASDHVVFVKRFPGRTHSWKGSLPFGSYRYRLRTLDHDGLAGPWGELTSFLVTPSAPRLLIPLNRSRVLYELGTGVTLKWGPVNGVGKFLVSIQGTDLDLHRTVKGEALSLPMLRPGTFRWSVTPILEGAAKQGQVVDSKRSEIRTFRLEMVKDALNFDEDLQRVRLLHLEGNSSIKPKDYLCLYPERKPLSGPVACGLAYQAAGKTVRVSLLYQSQHLSDGGRYYLADPTTLPKRSLASLMTSGSLYQVSGESARFQYDLALGVMAGTTYYLPSLEAQMILSRSTTLGLRYGYENSTKATASLRISEAFLTLSQYLGNRSFSGFFGQAGLGVGSSSATTSLGNQSRLSEAGFLAAGWQWRPSQQGFNVSISLGAQYLTNPQISVLVDKTYGLLPLATLMVGYAF